MKHFFIGMMLMCFAASSAYAGEKFKHRTLNIPEGTLTFSDLISPSGKIIKSGADYIKFNPKNPACLDPVTNPCFAETPASLACVYRLTTFFEGCNPQDSRLQPPSGGWGTIALLAAGSDANAYNDLTSFSNQFTPTNVLPLCSTVGDLGGSTPCFCQIDAGVTITASTPCTNGTSTTNIDCSVAGTCLETSIDTQWSHAMAPKASILLVEACSAEVPSTACQNISNSTVLQDGLRTASDAVSQQGGGEVSQSYSFHEFPTETIDGGNVIRRAHNDIVYFTSSGDYGTPARYPASSPYNIAAGATKILRDANGNFVSEIAWGIFPLDPACATSDDLSCKTHSTGGLSLYEPRPAYQNIVQRTVGTHRGTPDISFCGDPASGMFVYDSNTGDCPTNNWCITGGTSLASPALAGVINVATGGPTSTTAELTKIYSNFTKNYTLYWREITTGYNGTYAGKGYNLVTGIGTPLTYQGK